MIQPFLEAGFVVGLGSLEHIDSAASAGPTDYSADEVLIAWQSGSGSVALYTPDFFLQEKPVWQAFAHWQRLKISELAALLRSFLARLPNKQTLIDWQGADAAAFALDFAELKQLIAEGHLTKGVPYAFDRAHTTVTIALRAHMLLSALEQTGPREHIFGAWDSHQGLLGATPEILFTLSRGRQLRTMALAGTEAIEGDREAFLTDPKQVFEHQVVVADLAERLQGLGQLTLEPMTTLELKRLRHLLTELRLELTANVAADDLIAGLHPTPALGAQPRPAGRQWLQRLDQRRPRHRFGAPWAVRLADENVICLVAIRQVQWWPGELWLGAGCGIVAQSQLDQEWREIQLKQNSVKVMLGILR